MAFDWRGSGAVMLANRVRMAIVGAVSGDAWLFSQSPPESFVFLDWNDGTEEFDYFYRYNGAAQDPFVTSGADSFSRPYYETGGFRYTKGRTRMDLVSLDEYYKICRTTAGFEAPEAGD